jgi:hypothetical protein
VTAGPIIAVLPADDDMPCRRCGLTIERGQRAALVLGTGQLHLRCLLSHQADDTTTTTEKDHDGREAR